MDQASPDVKPCGEFVSRDEPEPCRHLEVHYADDAAVDFTCVACGEVVPYGQLYP